MITLRSLFSKRALCGLLFVSVASALTTFATVVDDAREALDDGRFSDAVTILEQGRKANPRDSKLSLMLGEAYIGLGRKDDAEIVLTQAANGGQFVAYSMLVNLALEKLDIEQAENLVEKWRALLKKIKRNEYADVEAAENRITSLQNYLERIEDVETIARFELPRSEFDNKIIDVRTGSPTDVFFTRKDNSGILRLWTAGILDDGSLDNERELTEYIGGGNIISPFLLQDGETLYFASDRGGENSLGGYDLYMTRRDGEGGFLDPTNLGMPYNSPSNDYLFVLDEDKNMGWWVSDRIGTDSVEVIVFRPGKTRINISPDADDIIDKALAQTLKNPTDGINISPIVPVYESSGKSASSEADMLVSLGNGRIISSPDELKTAESEDLWFDLVDLRVRLDDENEQLTQYRLRYGKGERGLAPQIRELESTVARLYNEYRAKLNRLIKMEQ